MGGLLKTIVLPYFACLHAFTFASIFLVGKKFDFAIIAYSEAVGSKLTALESHLMGAVGAFHCAVGFGCVIGVISEHSHFRGIMAIMELMIWALDGYDAYSTGFPYTFMAVNTAIATIGLAIHSQEPGIFTKDHNKEKTG